MRIAQTPRLIPAILREVLGELKHRRSGCFHLIPSIPPVALDSVAVDPQAAYRNS